MKTVARWAVGLTAAPAGCWVVFACWCVQQLPRLPAHGWALAALTSGFAVVLAAVAGMRARAWLLAPGIFLAAGGWAILRAESALAERLSPAIEGVALTVVGVVEELPQAVDRGVRFRFRVERCEPTGGACPGEVAVRLGWQGGRRKQTPAQVARLRPGQRWRLQVKLKRAHSTLNPGLFDPELRSIEDGIAAVGSVRAKPGEVAQNQMLDDFVPGVRVAIELARASIRSRVLAALRERDPAASGVVVALVVGDQAAIPGQWWEVFNRTGIGHLVSISGLHITMLAGLGAWLAGAIWGSARLARAMPGAPLASWLPVAHARWAVGLAVAFGYSALAGWGIPAQRTCWMLAAAGAALLAGRARATAPVLCTAAAVVCVLDPWAPMAAGFWLSFAAVSAIIWFGSWRGRREPRRDAVQASAGWRGRARRTWVERLRPLLAEALRTQVAATLALVPLGVLFFASVSLVSPFANAIAIPLVSAVITPLAMAGAAIALVVPWLGAPLLVLACSLTRLLLSLMQWMQFDGAGSLAVAQPGAAALLLAVAACAVLLAPVRLPGRPAAVLGLVPLLVAPADQPAQGELRVTAIDVGQGMAVLVEGGGRRLLFDTGPSLSADADAGSRTIVPWLRSRGITRVHALVVSHLDDDHSGGARSVLRGVSVDWAASSIDPQHPIALASRRHFSCLRGEAWRWGEVRFEWLHPGAERPPGGRSRTNARSCVLRVESPAGVVLLPGDLETAQEKRLLAIYDASHLKADVLVAPHHGSATSSSAAFLRAVRPRYAIFQVGYRNRFGHPKPAVLRRYSAVGARGLRSDEQGAVTITLRGAREPVVTRFRVDSARYWRFRPDESTDATPNAANDSPRS